MWTLLLDVLLHLLEEVMASRTPTHLLSMDKALFHTISISHNEKAQP